MTIAALKKNRIIPFECGDVELHQLFSYFLHKAPTVDSVSAVDVPVKKLDANWRVYIKRWQDNQYRFYERDYFSSKPLLLKYGLDDNSQINRLSRSFICTRGDINEKEYKCVLRHLRNAIAHGHVYYVGTENRKYVLLEDYKGKRKTALFLLSQKDLIDLKRIIMQ